MAACVTSSSSSSSSSSQQQQQPPFTEDEHVCFGAMGMPDLQSCNSSSSSSSSSSSASSSSPLMRSSNGRATPAILVNLHLQLAIRLVAVDQGSSVNIADHVLASRCIMDDLLDAVGCCTVSPLASSLGALVFGDDTWEFSLGQSTVADQALRLLHQLYLRTSNVKLFFCRLIDYVKNSNAAASSSLDVSEPLLMFILYALKSHEEVQLFHQVAGFHVNLSAFFIFI